ncbi:hypothetical protein ACC698_37265, partial [Rhizobium johnstonii]
GAVRRPDCRRSPEALRHPLAAFTAQIHASSRVGPDDRIRVPIDTQKMHFFLKSKGDTVG